MLITSVVQVGDIIINNIDGANIDCVSDFNLFGYYIK